ncbi:MAG: methyltransferase domain-containing protein [Pseudomonadales bacterium]|nr:methyltransferase domain-containing protein [Pseudomonadales bacterium]
MTDSTDSKDIDAEALRDQVKEKYRDVALEPSTEFHFHTGRALTERLSYRRSLVEGLPDEAVESFAGVANPFSLREIERGEKVVDAGSGAGFDCFVAQKLVGKTGQVVGVDMTEEMLDKSRSLGQDMNLQNVAFREGLLEDIPVEDGWADVVISNGVINLCADKQAVMSEIFRVLRPGGYLQFADIVNAKPIPEAALENIDLWTA